jgi:ATP phosphoribosyltransferase regulatory subunit
MAELYGQIDIFDRIAEYSSVLNKKSLEAIKRLKELYSLIDSYGYAKYISFDLSMLSKYSYYTGVFFRAITYGSGEPIAYGGRYDNLVKQFGLDVPAIGMSITVDYVLMGLERENILPEIEKNTTLLIFNEAASEKAIKKARELRSNGKDVKLIFDKTGERLQAVKEHEKLSENGQLNKFTNELEFFKVSDVIIMED